MRKNYIVTGICASLAAFILMSSSGGLSDDRTNAPSAVGNCGSCHSGGSFGASLTISVVKKGSLTQVTSYQLDSTYTVAIAVTSLTSLKKGFQATIINSSNSGTGTMSNASAGSNVQSIGNRQFAGHTSGSAIGAWTFDWKAPSAQVGNGTVTIYASGNATNSDNNSTGDQTLTGSKALTINNVAGISDVFSSVSIYPNPSNGIVNLPKDFTFKGIYTMDGKLLNVQPNQQQLDITKLNTGFYFVKLEQSGTTQTVKIHKQ
jgi:hypothetical protein